MNGLPTHSPMFKKKKKNDATQYYELWQATTPVQKGHHTTWKALWHLFYALAQWGGMNEHWRVRLGSHMSDAFLCTGSGAIGSWIFLWIHTWTGHKRTGPFSKLHHATLDMCEPAPFTGYVNWIQERKRNIQFTYTWTQPKWTVPDV